MHHTSGDTANRRQSGATGASTAVAVNANRGDPTGTTSLRRQYSQQFGKRWRLLKGVVWHTVGTDDGLGLRRWNADRLDSAGNALPEWPDRHDPADDAGAPDEETLRRRLERDLRERFRDGTVTGGLSTEAVVAEFSDWLTSSMDDVILGRGSGGDSWQVEYIRYAYAKGLGDARDHLESEHGVSVAPEDVEDAFNLPIHRDVFETVFRQTLSDSDALTETTAAHVRRELATGILRGENPRAVARTINDRLDSVGLTRSRLIARTETIRAYNEATLSRYERHLGADAEVSPEVEWRTAEDNRVCERCQAMAGRTLTIREARGMIPLHPNCRCRWTVATV